eukprot:TRINITY_DN68143_c6_g8_i1.p1 TRINITY_DN68143_c6_g8~~TRINITY_DN68143_c6_g8_i1.p1  ORF type:complete len:276 (-),score=48.93 TRINITY_DN68143_c6_g8_i1:201-1028(-)
MTQTGWIAAGKTDESAQGFEVANDADSLSLTSLTLEMWVNPTATWGTMFLKDAGVGTDTKQDNYAIWMNSGKPMFRVRANDNKVFRAQATTAIPTNQWTHLVGTLSGSTLKLYINGVVEGTTQLDSGDVPHVGGGTAEIGSRGAITIFGGALTDDQILYRYQMATCYQQSSSNLATNENENHETAQHATNTVTRINNTRTKMTKGSLPVTALVGILAIVAVAGICALVAFVVIKKPLTRITSSRVALKGATPDSPQTSSGSEGEEVVQEDSTDVV